MYPNTIITPLTYHLRSLPGLVVLVMLLVFIPMSSFASDKGKVVVTIKPLYSLTAQLMDGIEEPVLLMKQMQSPHHYNLRPSERRLISEARMIVWLGPNLESYLDKIINQQQAIIVTTIDIDGLQLLEKRGRHQHTHHDDKDNDHETNSSTASDKLDPHIWLSTANAITISRYVADRLIADDPDNAHHYRQNLERLVNRITEVRAQLKAAFEGIDQPYIAYHDAFQYFDQENGLNYIGSISVDEETSSSLKHLREISRSIEQNDIHCLVYQAPKPAIIDTLSRHTSANAVALDPLGLTTAVASEAWFDIMQTMARDLKQCLVSH
jgi:zinc transport system substrate-binding protein